MTPGSGATEGTLRFRGEGWLGTEPVTISRCTPPAPDACDVVLMQPEVTDGSFNVTVPATSADDANMLYQVSDTVRHEWLFHGGPG